MHGSFLGSRKPSLQSGISILQLLIAMGMLAVIAMGVSKSYQSFLLTAKQLRDREAITDLKIQLHIAVNCLRTRSDIEATCSPPFEPDDLVKVYGRVGDVNSSEVLIDNNSANPSKIGRIFVRAKCGKRFGDLDIEFATQIAPVGTANWNKLFPEAPFPCF